MVILRRMFMGCNVIHLHLRSWTAPRFVLKSRIQNEDQCVAVHIVLSGSRSLLCLDSVCLVKVPISIGQARESSQPGHSREPFARIDDRNLFVAATIHHGYTTNPSTQRATTDPDPMLL
jgi:hypothetical protein